MEMRIPIKIEVHEISEITPEHVMRAATRLNIKAIMDKHQAMKFLLELMSDLTIEEINEALKMEGFEIVRYTHVE